MNLKVAEKVQSEIVAVAGFLSVVGEGALQFLPPGALRTSLQVALPILATWRVRARVVPLAAFEALVTRLEKARKRK